ncbi:MAG: efflux RND transporter periplasmic adaptor subunit [Candidatus Cloacimonetes bacterium]|nr:efflux RND transporter periplasmic adaptor subunit [Candidatus Cloacimonadota bacterium]
MLYIRLSACLLLTVLLLAACQKPEAGTGQKPTEKERELTVPVLVQEVQPRDLRQYVNITGALEGVTDIVMSSETNGRVVELHKSLGDWVNNGEAIGRVDNESQRILVDQAEASMLAAEAAFEAAQRDWQAAQDLFARESISEWEHTQKKSAHKQAQAAFSGAQAGLELARRAYDHSRFVAPVSGYISSLNIEVGQSIGMGQPVCSIVNPRRLIIKTGIGESHIAGITNGTTVNIEHSVLDKPVEGRITGVGIKPVNGGANYPIEIVLDNRDEKLFPGMVVDGRIESEVFEGVLYIDKNAVLEEYSGDFVFLVLDDFSVEHRKVHLGRQIGDQVIIKSGLEAGDILVVQGMENLQESSQVVIRQSAQ